MADAGVFGRGRVTTSVRFSLTIALAVPLTVVGASASPVTAAVAGTNVVTTTDDVVANDGACSLREAIDAANALVPAVASAGECVDARRTIELQADATYVVNPALPPIVTNATINGNGATIQSQAVLRVLQIGNADGTNIVEIRDLTLTHRFASSGVTGRGLYVRSSAVVDNLTVTDNQEIGHGGGIYNENELTITDSQITDNANSVDGTREGGGIYNEAGSTLTIEGSVVLDNEAERDGGGIANHGVMHLTDVFVGRNTAPRNGGGILNGAVGTLTIDRGSISSNDAQEDGGAIDNHGSVEMTGTGVSSNEAAGNAGGLLNRGDAELAGVSWISNNATFSGGGLGNTSGGRLTQTDGSISNNEAGEGGGVYSTGELTITGTSVTANRSTGIGSLGGGGIYTASTPAVISGVVMFGNTSVSDGGAITGSSVTLRDAAIFDNESAEDGGGLDLLTSRIERVTVRDNVAGGSGGGVFVRASIIEASTFSDNRAGTSGGGLYMSIDSTLTNSTVSGNTSDGDGGGIYSVMETTIGFSTITDNTAPGGAGLRHFPEANTDGATLTASIVAGNHGSPDVELDPRPGPQTDGNVNSLGYNVIGSVGAGIDGFTADGDLVDADAKLDPLTDNGGPTRTHRPQPDSPALDRVPIGAPEIAPDEQRGLLRRPLGDGADSGAVECCEAPFFSRTPTRIVDTREGGETVDGDFAGDGAIEGDTVYEVQVAGRVPGGIVGTVIMNVTTVDSTGNGFLTIYDCEERPLASSLNYGAGRTANNEVIAELDDAGRLCVYAKTTTHVVIDAVGGTVFQQGTDLFGQRLRYRPIDPSRLLETRSGHGLETIDGNFEGVGAIDGDAELELQVTGRDGAVIDEDAVAVVVNLSTVGSLGNGFLTVYDCEDRPLASGINYSADGVVNNEIVTSLSPRGTICIYAKATTHVVVDMVGYLLPGSGYRPVSPARLLETRPGLTTIDGVSAGGGAIAGDDMIEVQIAGRGGVAPDAAQATVNVSALTGVGNGFLTIWDCGDRPLASAINYGPGRVVNNEVIVGLSDAGTICIYAKTTAHVIVDVVGFSNELLGGG